MASLTFMTVVVCLGMSGVAQGSHWMPAEHLLDTENSTICFLEVALPEELMLDPYSFVSLGRLCDGYLEGCIPIFETTCEENNETCTNETNYIEWMTSHQIGSQSFICSKTLEFFTDTAKDDHCSSYTYTAIEAALNNMMLVAYYGNTTNCGAMEDVFNGVLLSLTGCSNLELHDEFHDYFQTIVDLSPCAGSITLASPVNKTVCFEELFWPEDLMLNAYDFKSLSPICNYTYLDGCASAFESSCSDNPSTCTNETNYLDWMLAYRTGTQNYVCKESLQKFKDEYNDDCVYSKYEPLAKSLINLMMVFKYGNTTDCSDMSNVFNNVLSALSGCDTIGLVGEFKDYFQAVVDVSPCEGEIVLSSATTQVANVAVTAVTLAVALFTTFYSQ